MESFLITFQQLCWESILNGTSTPPRIPLFYTLTKILRPVLTGRPIFRAVMSRQNVYHYFQTTSYSLSLLKSTKILPQRYHTVNLSTYRKRKVSNNAISFNGCSCYQPVHIPQEEGINTVCKTCEAFYKKDKPIPINSLHDHDQRVATTDTTRELLPVQWKKQKFQITLACPRLSR